MESGKTGHMRKCSNFVMLIVVPYLISAFFVAAIYWGFSAYAQLVFHEFSSFFFLYKWGTIIASCFTLILFVFWLWNIIREKKINKLNKFAIIKSATVFFVSVAINWCLLALLMKLTRFVAS